MRTGPGNWSVSFEGLQAGENRIVPVFRLLTESPSADDQGIHGHRAGAAIDNANGMCAGSQTGHFTCNLLVLARSSGGQIRRRTALAVNLNFDLSCSFFFRSDD